MGAVRAHERRPPRSDRVHRFHQHRPLRPPRKDNTMAIPSDIGIIDTMIGFPHKDMKETYRFITSQTKDRQSKEEFAFPVEYMFKDVPEKRLVDADDPIGVTLREMDQWGIERGMIGVGAPGDDGELAL